MLLLPLFGQRESKIAVKASRYPIKWHVLLAPPAYLPTSHLITPALQIIWNALLDARIQLQKALNATNSLASVSFVPPASPSDVFIYTHRPHVNRGRFRYLKTQCVR